MTKPDAVKAFNMIMDKSDEIALRHVSVDKCGLYPSHDEWMVTFRARIFPEEVNTFNCIDFKTVTRFLEE